MNDSYSLAYCAKSDISSGIQHSTQESVHFMGLFLPVLRHGELIEVLMEASSCSPPARAIPHKAQAPVPAGAIEVIKRCKLWKKRKTDSSSMTDAGRSEYIEERLSKRSEAIRAEDMITIGVCNIRTYTMGPTQNRQADSSLAHFSCIP